MTKADIPLASRFLTTASTGVEIWLRHLQFKKQNNQQDKLRPLGVTLQDRVPNKMTGRRTELGDAMKRITNLKLEWAGHGTRMPDKRWTMSILQKFPGDDAYRSIGRIDLSMGDDEEGYLQKDIYKLDSRCLGPKKVDWLKRDLYVQQ